ncbi:hypothetical protein OB2597_00400 [Pseudooceanicola batsensis HTCC2597]|uniref:Uncharacterized protein n=1 Tax=Pseudooceanicola batsensis (strain ATCC BAA-863 / DSM 15984 / KCTC 12145 / HTCC2597) TaxID=252305 RepID=A3U1J0_PSEBH|nr:hypothetical protein [Pseudooceanicola batsensis]EAQ01831.1 hypothetical protein OB2597_00400 [Pseudooceanicola batsensis HTCC2597]
MTNPLAIFALIAMTGAAAAEVVPRAEQTPGPIFDMLKAEAQGNGEEIDGVAAWEIDLEGDGTTEWLVQPALWTGGNSISVRTYLFDGADTGFGTHANIGMNRSLKRVEQEGRTISLVIFELLENDPRCCPSGESTRILQIGE